MNELNYFQLMSIIYVFNYVHNYTFFLKKKSASQLIFLSIKLYNLFPNSFP